MISQNSPLKYTWKTQNVPQFSDVPQDLGSRDHTFFYVW